MAPGTTGLAEGAAGPKAALNDFGRRGYGGPCAPRGDRPHRYVFRLAVLSGPIEAPADATCADVRRLAGPMVLASAELTRRFRR